MKRLILLAMTAVTLFAAVQPVQPARDAENPYPQCGPCIPNPDIWW